MAARLGVSGSLLEIRPDIGPAAEIAPGATFESLRAWVLPFDSTDCERCGLAVPRLYRVIAAWVTENPLMMHVRFADERTFTNAIWKTIVADWFLCA
jgi:hypothetical protein